jgi:hypothetical protein
MPCCVKNFLDIKNTAAVNMWLQFRVMWSTSLIQWSVILWSAWKLNWPTFSTFLSSVCFWIVIKICFSNSLPVEDKRLIGQMFGEKLGSSPSFGRVMTSASFHSAGKWPSPQQRLNKCIKCTRDLVGWCKRCLFGMPSKPQAFPNFKDCISFEMSQGQKLTACLHQQ